MKLFRKVNNVPLDLRVVEKWPGKERVFAKLYYPSLLVAILFFNGCKHSDKPSGSPLFTMLDSSQTRISFINNISDTGSLNILDYLYYYNGAGVAAGDVNNDGFADLFFVSNNGANKLYLNKGGQKKYLQFDDISASAGIEGHADWKTGVTMADVNGDGWLDIYVCAVGNFKGLQGSNELFINNGAGPNGQVTFTESASGYDLNFSGFSTQAAFFDYDKDGDLDMYLLNHAVHTSRSYGRASARGVPDNMAGDYLFQNQHISGKKITREKKFKDVSKQSGIYQAAMGYGLGIAVADFNNDGWEDIYVGNDFHEDDYYYINNHDGSFKEKLKDNFGHVSRFSMGCDAADINNDGYPDLMTLDMYPEDEGVEKSSAGEDPFDIFLFKLQYGYYYQYSRNALQLNRCGQGFSEIGLMAGVAATDWSWSTLIADYDNDGLKDIFITNGIVHRPNDLDFIKFISNGTQQPTTKSKKDVDRTAISLMPDGKVHNYIFRGTERRNFEDKSLLWGFDTPAISNGAAYADLDNDGDLELIVNRINEPAGIYKNNAIEMFKNNYHKVKLLGDSLNNAGIGAKVFLKHKGKLQLQQLMPTRGFLSSSEHVLTFGLGRDSLVDTLIVIWPNLKAEIRINEAANTTAVFKQSEASLDFIAANKLLFPETHPLLKEVTNEFNVEYKHRENIFYDFYREPLIPFQVSTEGPKLAVADVNGDELEDFYLGGAKDQAGRLFIQKTNRSFEISSESVFQTDAGFEDTDAVFFDADKDGDQDLYVVSGGNEYYGNDSHLPDRIYQNDGKGNFKHVVGNLPAMHGNKSCVKPCDFDNDGDIDLFVGGRAVANQYGVAPDSYLLINNGVGVFSDQTEQLAPKLRKTGMVTDAQWVDLEEDGDTDLIVVGDWMPIQVFENKNNAFSSVKEVKGLERSNGFWQTIESGDFDRDGDTDFLVGNLGTNSKLRKTENANLRLYIKDIDNNGSFEHILAYQIKGKWYPAFTKDDLSKQLPLIRKKFTDYKSFAGSSIEEIFDKNELTNALELNVNRFESIYLENVGAKQFKQHVLPDDAQVSKIFAFHIEDLDCDGNFDVLIGGNFYGVSMYQGRYDASNGLVLKGDGNGNFNSSKDDVCGFSLKGEVRDIKSLNKKWILVSRNNASLQVFEKTTRPAATQVGAQFRVEK